MPRALPALVVTAILAYAITIVGGVRHDYIYYLEQWQLVLAHADPWSTNNAYGPLHNLFAVLLPIHPLAPKVATTACLLVANGLLILALDRERPGAEWLSSYLLAFGANFLVLIAVLWLGNNDGFVAALIIGAVLARRDGRMILCGVLLGLATLDKYYPALLIPFFALDARIIQPRLIISAVATTVAGILVAIVIWGTAYFEAIAFGVSRDATILSVLRPITVIGRDLGVGPIVDLLVLYNGPAVLTVWIAAVIAVWVRRDNWLVGATWGFFAVLLTYKVGNQQFWVSWLALVACLPLVGTPQADRLARLSRPYACFLSLFQLGFVLIQPEYYRGQWEWVKDYVGLPSFVLGLVLLVSFWRAERAVSHAAS